MKIDSHAYVFRFGRMGIFWKMNNKGLNRPFIFLHKSFLMHSFYGSFSWGEKKNYHPSGALLPSK